jgi:hypothetical protein
VRTRISRHRKNENRLTVIDLPSFPDQKTRLLALNSVLSTIWDRARSEWADALEKSEKPDERVPTFIVVDEAHNLLPKETDKLAAKALLDQFRTIAAEGRKYGLFLILCTQRPDKIDELVISECENQAVMRLGSQSQSVLDLTTKLLGLEKVPDRDRCLTFKQGRALLAAGRCRHPNSSILQCAGRKRVEKICATSIGRCRMRIRSPLQRPKNHKRKRTAPTCPVGPVRRRLGTAQLNQQAPLDSVGHSRCRR